MTACPDMFGMVSIVRACLVCIVIDVLGCFLVVVDMKLFEMFNLPDISPGFSGRGNLLLGPCWHPRGYLGQYAYPCDANFRGPRGGHRGGQEQGRAKEESTDQKHPTHPHIGEESSTNDHRAKIHERKVQTLN